MNLVEVRESDIYCDSHVVANKFGYKPGYVVKHIKNVISDIQNMEGVKMFTPKVTTEERVYRGTAYTAYLMNRDFFSILAVRFKGKKAFRWQAGFVAAFNAMERRLLDADKNATDPVWLGQREQGKIARRNETDVIKEFVEYATLQGSTKANFYYKHITNATYKALGLMVQKKPKLRDTMNLYEISELLLAERVAQGSLKKYMGLKREYHDIYNSVRDDLVTFANGLRIE